MPSGYSCSASSWIGSGLAFDALDASPFEQVLVDAMHLGPHLKLSYAEDVRWLFQRELWRWLEEQGLPVLRRYVDLGRIRQRDAVYFPGSLLSYETGVPANPKETITAKFCLRYGFEAHSHKAVNYRHQGRRSPELAFYVQDGPLSLGNFAVVLDRPPVGYVTPLPGSIRCCGLSELPFGKTRSVWAWLGTWFSAEHYSAQLLADLRKIPSLPEPQKPTMFMDRPSAFMRYFGHMGDDETSLRSSLGFKEKGKPVREEILYRSVCEVFGRDSVKRRYRGKELQGLEIDVWIPSKKIGFEYQGEQHFRNIPHWHGKRGFEAQQERDKRKVKLCQALGYRLLLITPRDDLSREGIVRKLRAANYLEPDYRGGSL